MNLLLDSIINNNIEAVKKTLKQFEKTTLNKMISAELLNQNFKDDTFDIINLLLSAREIRGIEHVLGVISALEAQSLPELHSKVTLHENFTNDAYYNLLKIYNGDTIKIPFTEGYSYEKLHAISTFQVLNAMQDMNTIRYTGNQSGIRNLLVKSVLSHQSYCFSCGDAFTPENVTIDHLIPQGHQKDNAFIQEEHINDFCNLGKMCERCNNIKADKLLITFYQEKKGFKFYPLNVLYILYLQKNNLLDNVENSPERSLIYNLRNKLQSYIRKHNITDMNKLKKEMRSFPNGVFPEIGRRSFLRLFSIILK